ncbi:hypothetical protein ABZX97_07510 [Streptomyces seoulensis]
MASMSDSRPTNEVSRAGRLPGAGRGAAAAAGVGDLQDVYSGQV